MAVEKITRLRGFRDVVPQEAERMSLIEDTARRVVGRYNFNEIRIPLMERIELYARSSGDSSDVVEKQMYVVNRPEESLGSGRMVLRPEGTPGVIRAYIDETLDDPRSGGQYQKYFYSGPMLRYERPQKGRYRQFWQFGVEVLGRADADCDAELIVMIDDLRQELERKLSINLPLRIEVNSLGCSICRPMFRKALTDFGIRNFDRLCEDCKRRLERNPIRILDCKKDVDFIRSSNVPTSKDFLCAECKYHFDQVKASLEEASVEYTENPYLVRGLDYYTRTAFEVISTSVGSQSAVVAGGRYDGLVEALGGAAVPGIGFAIGVDRLTLAVFAAEADAENYRSLPETSLAESHTWLSRLQRSRNILTAVIPLGASANIRAKDICRRLRLRDFRLELLNWERGMKAQLQRAVKIGARWAWILGDNELLRPTPVVQVRDLEKSHQYEVPMTSLESLPSVLSLESLLQNMSPVSR